MAKRVDTVRQTLLAEEARWEKFRVESVTKIHKETQEAIQERDQARNERDEARTQRNAALRPLDAEWAEVAKAKKQASYDNEIAQGLIQKGKDTDSQAQKAALQAANTLSRAATREDSSRAKLRFASEAERKAKMALRRAEKRENETLALAEAVTKELSHRDAELAAKERGYTMKEANLNADKAELAKGWKLLEDRRKVFERQITRTKK